MIAVSGATGFLGAHLVCKLLHKGKAVKALKRVGSNMAEFNYIYSLHFGSNNSFQQQLTWVTADILDVPALDEALHHVSEMYHCAAVVSFHKRDKEMMMRINIEGTSNVVNSCLNNKVQKLAYISSIAALGREKSGNEISEKTKWANSKNNTQYAISKHKAEMEVWRGIEEGLNAAIVNPGVILGSGTWHKGSCALFNMVNKGMPFYTNGVNGYVDVQDVADAAIFLMDKNTFGHRYILVGENVEMKWFLDEVSTQLNKNKPRFKVNKLLAEISWMGAGIASKFTGKKPSLTKETARASLNKFYYSSKKIKQQGFEFKSMIDTITETCTNFKQQQTL